MRSRPSKTDESMEVRTEKEPDTWITPYQLYLEDGVLPLDVAEAKRIKKSSSKFTLIDGNLFRFGFSHPMHCLLYTSDAADE